MPLDIIIETPKNETVTSDTYIDLLQLILHDWNMRDNKHYYDLTVSKTIYKVGDWDWFTSHGIC